MALIGKNKSEIIVLSICIPTYNRSKQLRKSLDSIVSQSIFRKANKIQVVISDNCSSDDTQAVVEEFFKKFGPKIKYSRTESNILDRNIERVLSLGDGQFLKLANDTLIHLEGSLDYYLRLIEANFRFKNVLFFSNGLLEFKDEYSGSGIDQFVNVTSYYSTWIASFGVWKSDFELIDDFGKCSHLHLIQLDNLLALIQKKKEFVISNVILFDIQESSKKGGFDIISVFLENYSLILSSYLKSHDLYVSTYEKELQLVVKKFIINGIMLSIFYPSKFNYNYKNGLVRLFRFFSNKPLFLVQCFLLAIFYFFKFLTKKILTAMKLWVLFLFWFYSFFE